MANLTVVCFKWKPTGWRRWYNSTHVNNLYRMVQRHLHIPHKFLCITDDANGLECETYPLWNELSIENGRKPNCFKRLKLFDPDFFIDDYVMWLDLDTLIHDDISPLIDFDVDFKMVQSRGAAVYNGSMLFMKQGARPQVYTEFTPKHECYSKYIGSDQAWISHMLPGEKMWTRDDGIYFFAHDVRRLKKIPKGAKIIFFPGGENIKPWSKRNKDHFPYISEAYNAASKAE